MYLDCKKLSMADTCCPLRLRTLDGRELGPIPFVHNVRFTIHYTELSEIEFSVPRMSDGLLNPLYEAVSGYKTVYTDTMGIYVLQAPRREGDGFSEEKTVTGYSLEYLFGGKTLFLEEGTYNFWDPANPSDTVLGRVLELDGSWSAGYVTPRLIGCYRTFDQYDANALDFCYGDAMEKYRCAIVFDVYNRTVSAYDAQEDRGSLPVYLSFDNLLSTVGVDEVDEELVTKLRPCGADGLTVREVNPTGSDCLVNLDYFIHSGDLDVDAGCGPLSGRVRDWGLEVEANRPYYAASVASRSSTAALKLSLEADLTDLKGELDTLTAQQSITIQAHAMEKDDAGRAKRQEELDKINDEIHGTKENILRVEGEIRDAQADLDYFDAEVKSILEKVGYEAFFTGEERAVLCPYLIEGELDEDSFVASDLDVEASAVTGDVSGTVRVSGSSLVSVYLEGRKKTVLTASGGRLYAGVKHLEGEIIRGVLDMEDSGTYVLTVTLGLLSFSGHSFQGGMFTLHGTMEDFHWDVKRVTQGGVQEDRGTRFDFQTARSKSYFTVNATEFTRYSAAMELYEFGQDCLKDLAWPTYEFSVDSANFLYQEKFEPFRDATELGKSVHLDLGGDGVIDAKLIGFTLDLEDASSFSLVFSNRYKLRNQIEALRDEVASASRATRSFDASKYLYNRTADRTTQAGRYIEALKRGAAEAVLTSGNQSVVVGGTGIHIGGESDCQLRLTDSMIAMSDDGWKTAKVGIGRFASPETGAVFGVNAELLAGTMFIGKNMVLQNPLVDENNQPTGTMLFKVDATGAWLYNSRIVLQGENGLILADPGYGIAAGTKLLFDTNGTTVTPEFLDEAGEITFDKDGMPENANFFLDINTGNAYFRGKVHATDGVFNGTVYAKAGEFTGTLKAASLEGDLVSDKDKGGWIRGPGISVGGDYMTGTGNFHVDQDGNLTLKGSINLSNGSITWGSNVPNKQRYAASMGGPWHDTMQDGDLYCCDWDYAGNKWGPAYKKVGTDGKPGTNGSDANVSFNNIVKALQTADGVKKTFITANDVGAPTIYGAKIYGAEIYAGGVGQEGGQVIGLTDGGISIYNGKGYGNEVLTIYGDEEDRGAYLTTGFNALTLSTPHLFMEGTHTIFKGYEVDFTEVENVVGLHATFA